MFLPLTLSDLHWWRDDLGHSSFGQMGNEGARCEAEAVAGERRKQQQVVRLAKKELEAAFGAHKKTLGR